MSYTEHACAENLPDRRPWLQPSHSVCVNGFRLQQQNYCFDSQLFINS